MSFISSSICGFKNITILLQIDFKIEGKITFKKAQWQTMAHIEKIEIYAALIKIIDLISNGLTQPLNLFSIFFII